MTNKIIVFFIFFGLLVQKSFCFAQSFEKEIKIVNAYIRHLDSLIDNEAPEIKRQIEDGLIKSKIVTRKQNSKGIPQPTTVVAIAGFSNEIFSNRKSDTIYKFQYHSNQDKNYYETYYYRNNKLVAANVSINNDRDGFDLLLSRDEYYSNDKIVFSSISKPDDKSIYNRRISFSLFEKGNNLLNEALKEKVPKRKIPYK